MEPKICIFVLLPHEWLLELEPTAARASTPVFLNEVGRFLGVGIYWAGSICRSLHSS